VPEGPERLSATFFSPTTGAAAATVPVGSRTPEDHDPPTVSVSPDRRLVAVRTEAAVTVLDAADHQVVGRYEPGPTPAPDGTLRPPFTGCLAWAPDSSRVLVCTRETEGAALTAIDPRGGAELRTTPTTLPLDLLVLSGDRRSLAGVNLDDGVVVALDPATLEIDQVVTIDPGGTRASHLSFSPDGTRIAVSGGAGLEVVDTRSWERDPAPAPLTDEVRQAEWFRDGRTLAVVGMDGTTYLYDVEQGQAYALPLLTPDDDPDAGVHLVPGIADELVVLVGHRDGRRYPMDPATWSSRACAVVGRDLTEDEWERYLPNRDREPTCSAPG
jgi:WD40 repeat protein